MQRFCAENAKKMRQDGGTEFEEPLINSATHLHTSTLSSRRRQILDVAPLRLRFTRKPQEVKPKAQTDWLASGKGGAQCPQSGRLCV